MAEKHPSKTTTTRHNLGCLPRTAQHRWTVMDTTKQCMRSRHDTLHLRSFTMLLLLHSRLISLKTILGFYDGSYFFILKLLKGSQAIKYAMLLLSMCAATVSTRSSKFALINFLLQRKFLCPSRELVMKTHCKSLSLPFVIFPTAWLQTHFGEPVRTKRFLK